MPETVKNMLKQHKRRLMFSTRLPQVKLQCLYVQQPAGLGVTGVNALMRISFTPSQRRDRTGLTPVKFTVHAVLGYAYILALFINNVNNYLFLILN